MTTDNRTPYRVYGAQQDNTTMSRAEPLDRRRRSPTRSGYDGRRRRERLHRGPIRDDPNIVYAGCYDGLL